MPDVESWITPLIDIAYDVGLKVLGALVLWVVGRMLIGMVQRVVGSRMDSQKVDPTLVRYVHSTLAVLLNIVLILAVLSIFGVETTSFAGLLAAGGVAIGMAWSGLLSNFAAGAFLMVLRPFKVGDLIQAGGVLGQVEEIGLFVTTLNTPDNVRTFVGNNAIFSGNIQTFMANPHRRVDLTAQLAHSVDHSDAIKRLEAKLATIPNVLPTPAPDVEILTFNLAGPVLAVRPYCHNDDYWQVYFDTNRAIREEFGAAGYGVPEQHYRISQQA